MKYARAWLCAVCYVAVFAACPIGSAQELCDCTTQPSGFAAGSGTVEDPFQICAPDQLNNVRNQLAASFVLTDDLDMTGFTLSPIGDVTTPFTGDFDGRIFTIRLLSVDNTGNPNTGLFGVIGASGVVRNLRMHQANVVGSDFTGIFAGINEGTIEDCSANGVATGAEYVGGMVGENRGTIMRCLGGASQFGTSFIGGVAGRAVSPALIVDSIGEANIQNMDADVVGGLLGVIDDATVTNCRARIFFDVVPTTVGGLIARDDGVTSSVTSSYWGEEESGVTTSAGGEGKTIAEMEMQSTFVGWDFTNVWTIDEGFGEPRLRSILALPVRCCNADVDASGQPNIADWITVLSCALDGSCDGCVASCDVNLDGTIDYVDLGAVLCQNGAVETRGFCCSLPTGACQTDFQELGCVITDVDNCTGSPLGLAGTYSGDGTSCGSVPTTNTWALLALALLILTAGTALARRAVV